MKVTVNHPVYGEIIYSENVWSGKKSICINSVELDKKNKTTFLFNVADGMKEVKVIGSELIGVKLNIDENVIEITPPTKWYEYLAAMSLFMFVMIWGNNEALVAIFPIVGGGIGGAISGFMMCMTVMALRSVNKWYLKVLVWLGMFIANALICFIVALLLVFALA